MLCILGRILTYESFEEGYIILENNTVKEVGKIPPIKPRIKGYIIPKPVNAHTHIGDTFVRKKIKDLPRDIEKLVAPPKGLKHRMLERVSDKEILQGMEESIGEMVSLGTYAFCDFRESGIKGVNLLKKAMEDYSIRSVILSRPKGMSFDRDEIEKLLRISDGIGVSSISDWNYEYLENISKIVKGKGKIFSLHASERVREDIDKILDLKPDFLIHMNKASKNDLERVAEEEIPVVVCPRSNIFFGLKPKIELMKRVGIKLSLGTDNAMISSPDIFEEARWVMKNCEEISLEDILRMITYNPREMLNLPLPNFEEEKKAEFVVLDTKSLKPIFISGSEVS